MYKSTFIPAVKQNYKIPMSACKSTSNSNLKQINLIYIFTIRKLLKI